jgi:hypothetical protein
VNILWLEEVFLKWSYLREAQPRFVKLNIPVGLTWGVVGQIDSFLSVAYKTISNGNEDLDPKITPVEKAVNEAIVKENQINRVSAQSKKTNEINVIVKEEKENNVTPVKTKAEKRLADSSNADSNGKSSRKRKKHVAVDMRILFTGYRPTDAQRQFLERKQIKTATDMKKCTHVVTDQIRRTENFISAICLCKNIVSVDWLEECMKQDLILDETQYPLTDHDAEEKFQFCLSDALNRAKHHKLLKGWTFCASKNVNPKPETLKRIIENAGGVFKDESNLERISQKVKTDSKFIVVSCEQDLKQHIYLRKCPKVYSGDLILNALIRQEIDWNDSVIHTSRYQ